MGIVLKAMQSPNALTLYCLYCLYSVNSQIEFDEPCLLFWARRSNVPVRSTNTMQGKSLKPTRSGVVKQESK